jgi:hypothetical protein
MAIPRRGPKTPPTGTPAQGLLIVARDQLDLYHALEQAFGGSRRVHVLLDRRREERRRAVRAVESDVRRIERRSVRHIEEDLHLRKYVLVRPHHRRPHD